MARWRAWSATPRRSTASAFPVDDAIRRIESLYKPYHRALRRLFTRVHRDFGAAVLIDCHSMPSTAGAKDERPRADVVLGDRYGTSCVPAVAEIVEATLRGQGYVVSRNKPYAGGFITEHYGNPAVGLHAIQLEINRALYMDERRFERSASFATLAADLERWPIVWPTFRSRSCDRIGLLPNSARPDRRTQKKKGRRGCQRPKSREETPKEGSGSASATAPQ